MMIGLLVFAGGAAMILYICAVFMAAGKIQDWAMDRDYPPIAIPWAFTVLMLFVVPAAILAAVIA